MDEHRLSIDERRLRLDERRLRLDEQRIELVKTIIQLQPNNITEIVTSVFRDAPTPTIDVPIPTIDVPTNVHHEPFNAHRPQDKRVQQYDPSIVLVAVHEGLREAARAIEGGKSEGIRKACVNNTLYLGFRWHLVDRNDIPSMSIAPTAPTALPKRRSGRIAQLNGTEIVAVHQDQIEAAKSSGLANSSSITIALKRATTAGNYRWAWWDDCTDDARAAWNEVRNHSGGVETITRDCHRGRRVYRLDPETNEVLKTFQNMSDVCLEHSASHAQLHKASMQHSEYRGFKWRVE